MRILLEGLNMIEEKMVGSMNNIERFCTPVNPKYLASVLWDFISHIGYNITIEYITYYCKEDKLIYKMNKRKERG